MEHRPRSEAARWRCCPWNERHSVHLGHLVHLGRRLSPTLLSVPHWLSGCSLAVRLRPPRSPAQFWLVGGLPLVPTRQHSPRRVYSEWLTSAFGAVAPCQLSERKVHNCPATRRPRLRRAASSENRCKNTTSRRVRTAQVLCSGRPREIPRGYKPRRAEGSFLLDTSATSSSTSSSLEPLCGERDEPACGCDSTTTVLAKGAGAAAAACASRLSRSTPPSSLSPSPSTSRSAVALVVEEVEPTRVERSRWSGWLMATVSVRLR
eukprot:scaffold212972_cov30-Tisochrysis_lutea.AAC.2